MKNILVPTDFSELSQMAIECAKSLAAPSNATIHVLYVDDDVLMNMPTTSQEYRDEFEDKMAMKFVHLLEPDEREQFHVKYALRSGDAAEQILLYADENDIDLIVIGTIGRSAIVDVLVGSVASKVLKHADCPVVSVRKPS